MHLNKITTTAAILTAAAALFFISTPTQQNAQAQTLEEAIQLAERFDPEAADAVRDALALLGGELPCEGPGCGI